MFFFVPVKCVNKLPIFLSVSSIIPYLYFIVTSLYFQETLVKNPISVAEELDFFADMQPVIQTNQQVMTPHDKFAPILQGNLLKGNDNKTVRRLPHLFSSQ